MSVISATIARPSSLSLRLFSGVLRASSTTLTQHHILNSAGNTSIQSQVDTHHSSITPFFNYPNCTGTVAITTYYQESITSTPSIIQGAVDSLQSLLDMSTWLIKRTFQPSIIRKRRKHGFLRRQESVGGRRVLKRRRLKGRMRLGGS